MSTNEILPSWASVAPFPQSFNGDTDYVATSGGILQTRGLPKRNHDDPARFIPTFFGTRSGRASIRFSDTDFMLRLTSDNTVLVMTKSGYSIAKRDAARFDLVPHTRTSGAEVGRILMERPEFRRALLELNTGLWVALQEYVARAQMILPDPVITALSGTSEMLGTFTATPSVQVCDTTKIVDVITREVWEVVTKVTSAVDQLLTCIHTCDRKSGLAKWKCNLDCGLRCFVDIVDSVLTCLGTITEEAIRYETHCVWQPGTVPTPWGTLTPAEFIGSSVPVKLLLGARPNAREADKLVKDLESYMAPLACLGKASWSVTKLGLGDIGVKGAIPTGVKVCFSPECTSAVRDAIQSGTLKSLGLLLEVAIAYDPATLIAAALQVSSIKAAAEAMVAATGIALEAATGLVLAFLLECAYQGLWILGQLLLLGATPNGVCFEHPLVTGLLIGPLALNVPVIVTKR